MIFFFCFSGHRKLYHLLPFHHYIDCCLLCMSVLVLVFSFAAKTKQKKYNTLTIFFSQRNSQILSNCQTKKQKRKKKIFFFYVNFRICSSFVFSFSFSFFVRSFATDSFYFFHFTDRHSEIVKDNELIVK